MKKILIGLLFSVIIISSCKKELEHQFPNPENYDKTGNLFSGMFTSTLYSWKLYVQDYGEWWWEIAGTGAMGVSGYSQIAQRYITDRYAWFLDFDDLSGTNAFGSENQLWQNRLGAFYGRVNAWAVIKDNIAAVKGQELDDNQIYFTLTTVLKDYAALLAVDFYNSIPYSEAFKGKEKVFFPKYDDPKEIYASVLTDLKQIAEELPGQYAKMTTSAKAVFANQDIAFGGDVERWIQYVNAIRLKYAVRISGVDETLAKTHISDLIAKNNFPTKDALWKLPYLMDIRNGGEWLRGMNEAWPGTFIPNIIMKRMNAGSTKYEAGTDDPRLPVIALPTMFSDFTSSPAVGDYRGVSMDADGQKAGYVAGERYYTGGPTGDLNQHFAQNSRSMYNFGTYTYNQSFPVYMMSIAETDLLLAEVALKDLGNTGKTAAEHINDAIVHSVNFWYEINRTSNAGISGKAIALPEILQPAKPTDAVITTFADSIVNRFKTRTSLDDKMELLMQQKYIHLNIMCPYELWTELRRTRHPKLEPMTFNTKVMTPLPERLRYPISEQQTNPDNYSTVKDQDNFTSPIFWVPSSLRTVVPYWDDYNYE